MFINKYRSKYQRCSIKKVVLKSLAKFIGKHLCQSLFFNKVVGLRSATLFKKRLCSVNFAKFLRTPLLQSTSGRLFLWMETNLNCFKPLMSCNECQEFSHTLTYTKNNLVLYLTFLLLLNFKKSSWNIKLFGSNWHMDDIGAVKPLKLLKSKLLPETSLKKSVYKNFANFTEKHLCWSFFLNKISVKLQNFWEHLFWRTSTNDCFYTVSRSSHRRCSLRKDVLRNFAKFTGKHLCQSLYFNILQNF